MADIQVFGAPITKLIEVVSAAVGVKYKPKAMRNEAEAEAYKIEIIAEAEAKAAIIKAEAETEIAQRARNRIFHQEMQRQINLDTIIDEAATLLPQVVSDEPIEENWRTKFFNKAQDIKTSDLQRVWARILAGEINKPGSYSLRTIDILSNLSKKEATVFNRFCGLCTDDGTVIKLGDFDLSKYNISHDDIILLREAGLVNVSDTLVVRLTAMPMKTDLERDCVILKFKNRGFILHQPGNKKIDLEVYGLTTSGQELQQTIPSSLNDNYFEDLNRYFVKEKFIVNETRLFLPLRKKSDII